MINNAGGTIAKPDAADTNSILSTAMDNDGLMDVSVGDLTINGSSAGASTGRFVAAQWSVLGIGGLTLGDGTTLEGPTAPGDGEVRIAGNIVDIPDTATVTATGRTGLTRSSPVPVR